jgi:hypothetical protein
MSLKLLMADNKWFTIKAFIVGWLPFQITCLSCGGVSDVLNDTTCDFICWMELHSNSCYESDSELVSAIAVLDDEWVKERFG